MADVQTLSRVRRTRLVLIALAAMAFFAGLLTHTASAADGSGGVGVGGGSTATPTATSTGGSGNVTPGKYNRLWDRVSASERKWAAKTSYCETGRDPNATALHGQYRGAFMFTWDAWRTSPKTPGGDPIDFSYRTQAVVAVMLMRKVGTGPWPVCG
jgi:hypothetical protein